MSTTTPQRRPAGSGPPTSTGPALAPPAAAPATRRSPALALASLALVAVSGVVVYTAVGQATTKVAVLALARTVPYGQQITASDLTVAHVPLDPALHPVPASAENQELGRRASATLAAGTLLVNADLTTGQVGAPGQSVVWVPVSDARINPGNLAPQQPVTLVYAPTGAAAAAAAPQNTTGTSPGPTSVAGTVISLSPVLSDGTVVIEVAVPTVQAPTVATWAAAGAVELITTESGG